jgi:hypothetical protein
MKSAKWLISLVGFSSVVVSSVVANSQVLWDQPATPSVAMGYNYKLYVTPSGQTTPQNIINLVSFICAASVASPNISACSAPVDQAAAAGATMNGAKSELTAIDPSGGFGESEKSTPFIMQNNCTPNPVKLNVGTWTRTLPTQGLGQVLYNLRQSTSSITTIVITFNGMVQDTLNGARLNNVAGSYFTAMVPAGSYQLAVEAIDINGCRDGGVSRPMTVVVQ